ncbi:MAG TPA: MBL fold metallo-hydrolase [Usitatibacter sp.]|nr:MBL fold metallo-hydrolase [Usitatibacter sp.]
MTSIMPAASLPPSIRVIVRGWLNCNQVVLRAPGDNVLVDSGYCTHREETLELIAGSLGLAGEPLERLVNTHCHSDHMGGNAAVASAHGCRVTIPEGEVKHVVPWTPQSVWMAQFDQRADPFHFDDTIGPGDCFEGGGFEWEAHAAPGHDMDALMFFEPVNRILISGDALWQDGMGFVWPEEGANPFIEAAHSALSTIERLRPAVVVPGHGVPFEDVAGSVATVRSRLEAFARDPARNARHVVKVMFVFALLERGMMPVTQVAEYVARVPCYRDMSDRFLGMDAKALAGFMLGDLERAGAVRIANGNVVPTMPA